MGLGRNGKRFWRIYDGPGRTENTMISVGHLLDDHSQAIERLERIEEERAQAKHLASQGLAAGTRRYTFPPCEPIEPRESTEELIKNLNTALAEVEIAVQRVNARLVQEKP